MFTIARTCEEQQIWTSSGTMLLGRERLFVALLTVTIFHPSHGWVRRNRSESSYLCQTAETLILVKNTLHYTHTEF